MIGRGGRYDLRMIRDLYEHMEWADVQVWNAVRPLGSDDHALREKLHHVTTVQRAFLQLWRGEKPAFRNLDEFADTNALETWAREVHAEVREFVASLDESASERIIDVPWARQIEKLLGHPPHPSTLRETMLQVATHTTYHRGQINTSIRELGGTPPLVDLIAWVWMGRPAPVEG